MLTVKLSVPKFTPDAAWVKEFMELNSCDKATAEVAASKAEAGQRVKGGTICVYGLNTRFPVALHPNQWVELAKYMPSILEYIAAEKAAGRITERVTVLSGDRIALQAAEPKTPDQHVVAALMAAKGVDEAEATRIAKQSGLIR